MRSTVGQLLRQRTAQTHQRVEASLGLLDAELSRDRLRIVLERFAGFWIATERVVDDWARSEPAAAAELDWSRRRRSEILRTDLTHLGLGPAELAAIPEAETPFRWTGTAEVLGWLYVSEGSTLGGAVIDRTLRALPDGASLRVGTFTPYAEGPGPMWRAFLGYLESWVGGDQTRSDAVVSAAELSFEALAAWLSPIASEGVLA